MTRMRRQIYYGFIKTNGTLNGVVISERERVRKTYLPVASLVCELNVTKVINYCNNANKQDQ
jgi:hypothetical protein